MTQESFFNFYDVQVQISAAPGAVAVLRHLEQDFAHFTAPAASGTADLQFQLRLSAPAAIPPRGATKLFRTRMGTAYRIPGGRYCDYGGGTTAQSRILGRRRVFEIQSPDTDGLYEAAYMALLSATGEALDRRGLHRVHALGYRARGKNHLVILPSGGGKSALAALLSNDDQCSFFSDEIPLLRAGRIHPYPIRMALKPEVACGLNLQVAGARVFKRKVFPEKLLLPIPPRQIAVADPLDFILVGKKIRGDRPRISRLRRSQAFLALVQTMAIGHGVPQMAEHMLRRNARLGRIFISRLREAWRVSQAAEIYRFHVVWDAKANAEVLRGFNEAGR